MAKKTTQKNTGTTTTVKVLKADPTILLNARITEKAARMGDMSSYTFNVAVGATKSEIKKAFILKYSKTPTRVHTINKKPDYIFRRGVLGKTSRTKKAYIYLPKGMSIDII